VNLCVGGSDTSSHVSGTDVPLTCSVVRVSIRAGEWSGNVEPFQIWRRLVCSVEGQESTITAGGIGNRIARFLPEVMWMRTGQFPGVAGMACMESRRVNHGRSGYFLCSRQSNLSSGKECCIQKSEQPIVVMTTGTTQPCQSKGVVRSQRLFESMTADIVLREVSLTLHGSLEV